MWHSKSSWLKPIQGAKKHSSSSPRSPRLPKPLKPLPSPCLGLCLKARPSNQPCSRRRSGGQPLRPLRSSSRTRALTSCSPTSGWDSQEVVRQIFLGLMSRGIKVWMDLDQMSGDIYEKMANAILNSRVVVPVLTLKYQASANCKIELNYAQDLRKHLVPVRLLGKQDQPRGQAFAITAGKIYVDFSSIVPGSTDWNEKIEALVTEIQHGTADEDEGSDDDADPPPPYTVADAIQSWLQPVDFSADMASYQREYVSGTRLWARDHIHNWLKETDQDSTRVLWLNGGAGVGKSMIAWLASQELPQNCVLGSIFFCRHNDQSKNNASRLVSTIAYDLSGKFPEFREHIEACYQTDKAGIELGQHSLLEQPANAFRTLIVDGLKKLTWQNTTILLVIDALDECGRQGDADREGLLSVLKTDCAQLPPSIKIFTTARPEADIWETLHSLDSGVLKPTDSRNIDDIELFVQDRLRRIPTLSPVFESELSEVSVSELQRCTAKLVERSEGVFVYSRIACEELSLRQPHTLEELEGMVDLLAPGRDEMYDRIMRTAFEGAGLGTVEHFQLVMGTILALREPLSQAALSSLIGVPESSIASTILRLRPVLNIESGLITVLHKSLKDYLTSRERCLDPRFYIDTQSFEHMLFNRSVDILSLELKENLFELEDPLITFGRYSATKMSAHLSYAVRFWGLHLAGSPRRDPGQSFKAFCNRHLLHWLEAMILLGRYPDISRNIALVLDYLNSLTEKPVVETELLQDAKRLVERFRIPITKNPLQIYYSALSFSPTLSPIYQTYYQPERRPRVLLGADRSWGSLLTTFEGHTRQIYGVAISTDNRLIATASWDLSIRLWLTETGECVKTLEGHSGFIYCVAFSSDTETLYSCAEDMTIMIWSVRTGKAIRSLAGHTGPVRSLALSEKKDLLVSGSKDGTIKVWSASTYECIRTLTGHESMVSSLVIAADGTTVVSGSWDSTIRLWSAETGECIRVIKSQTETVISVDVSPDGKHIASVGSMDPVARVWSVETGECVKVLEGHAGGGTYATFSSDAARLAIGCEDGSIHMWSAGSYEYSHTLTGHGSPVKCLAYSQDGSLLLSGSWDSKAKLWSMQVDAEDTDSSHKSFVSAMAFAPDAQLIATGSRDKTIKLWSLKTGQCVATLEGHGRPIAALAFSKSGQYLRSRDYDAVTKYWDVAEALAPKKPAAGSPWMSRLLSLPILGSIKSQAERAFVEYEAPLLPKCLVDKLGWYIRDDKPLFWVPSEFRVSSASSLGLVIFATRSGRCLVVEL
ncbi:WD40-repeat-containing domain protein [Polychytrium aggregatum]|uniref:WD40-repeat-containing domain protein n=1 Tax=Polychytrium aggregatum TaxID=110093 RepID=UPI0022FF2E75|nr:WD40-repeat-containing domain protein [Polychytrium aggregatum]KAI9208937.1 WD40-repeat-containing domain protein [Polychytrium aggregatum]